MAEDKLDVKVYNDKKELVDGEITMTYGLLNLLVRQVGDFNRVGVIDIDPDIAMDVLTICLIPRDAKGKPTVDVGSFEPPNMPPAEAEKIFSWVKEHILDFFLRRLQDTADLMTNHKDRLQAAGSLLTGSQVSPSETASSGQSA